MRSLNRSIAAVLVTFVALFAATAHANTPLEVSAQTFVRLGAEAASCADASSALNEDLSRFEFVYCGVIPDVLTDINKRWTGDKLAEFGFVSGASWSSTRQWYGRFHIGGFISPRLSMVVGLGVVDDYGKTIIVMAYNRN